MRLSHIGTSDVAFRVSPEPRPFVSQTGLTRIDWGFVHPSRRSAISYVDALTTTSNRISTSFLVFFPLYIDLLDFASPEHVLQQPVLELEPSWSTEYPRSLFFAQGTHAPFAWLLFTVYPTHPLSCS
jgi:hypothetical protein